MPIGGLLLAALLASGPVDRVVLRSGQVIAVAGEVRVEKGKVLFRSPAGVLYSIDLEEVDLDATQNPAASADPIERLDSKARHPVRKLNVTPEERDRLLAELARKAPAAAPKARVALLSPPPPETAEAGRADDSGQSEAWWRAEARAAREAVQLKKDEIARLRRRTQELEDELRLLLSSGYDPSSLTGQAVALESARNGLEAAEEALKVAQRAWTELQDRARREGVMPGWLRE